MKVKAKGYDDYEKQEKIAAYLLALFLLITIFSRSGNDVAKAVGPLMSIPEFATTLIPILLAGGVAANACLREIIVKKSPIPVSIPSPVLCTDNAAMIAACAYFRSEKRVETNWKLDVEPSLQLV